MNVIPQTEKVREPHHKILLNKVSDQIANIIIASVLFPNKKPHRLRAHSKPVLHLRQKRFRRNASFTRITTRTLDDLSRSVGGSRRRPSAGYSGYNNTTNATAAAAASSSSSSTHILTRTLSLSLSLCLRGGRRERRRPTRAPASARPSAAARRRATCLSVVEQGTEAAEKGSLMLRLHKPLPLHRFIEHCMGRYLGRL